MPNWVIQKGVLSIIRTSELIKHLIMKLEKLESTSAYDKLIDSNKKSADFI